MAQNNGKKVDIFKKLAVVPAAIDGDPAADAVAKAKYADNAADAKAGYVDEKLQTASVEVEGELVSTEENVALIQSGDGYLDLQDILDAYSHLFEAKKVADAPNQIASKSRLKLTSASAATFGTVPDVIVRMAVDSTFSKASGDARMKVARVLDEATGVAGRIKNDRSLKSGEIKERAEKIYANFENAKVVASLFEILYGMIQNRVGHHKNDLLRVYEDLGEKSVLLIELLASLQARQQMVINDLYNTCINGIALDAIIESAKADLELYREELKLAKTAAARGALNNKVSSQESLVSILIRRSVDLKAFAVTETGLITIIQKIYDAVSVVHEDVEFTRTNLIFTLGLTLGLIVDVVATIRIGQSTQNVRQAAANATTELGMASEAINELANKVLTDVDLTMSSVETTINAAIRAVTSTHEGLNKMLEIQKTSGKRLNTLLSTLGNA